MPRVRMAVRLILNVLEGVITHFSVRRALQSQYKGVIITVKKHSDPLSFEESIDSLFALDPGNGNIVV